MTHELILVRSTNDNEVVISPDKTENQKSCCVSHIIPSLQEHIRLNKIISKNTELPIKFLVGS